MLNQRLLMIQKRNNDSVPEINDPSEVLEFDDSQSGEQEYALGDIITLNGTVTNPYSKTKNIVLSTTDDCYFGTDQYGNKLETLTISNVAGNSSANFTAYREVIEDDLTLGYINPGEITATVDEVEVSNTCTTSNIPVEACNGELTIRLEETSTPANGESYALDEKINYRATVTNTGNLTITSIKIDCELTGDHWSTDSLAPGQNTVHTCQYTVTENDILTESVMCEVTASGTSQDQDNPEVVADNKCEVFTEAKNAHISVSSVTTSTPANEETYALDETIYYKHTVTNDGNLTVTDVYCISDLTTDTNTVRSLQPGESKEFSGRSHTVTEEDILRGEVICDVYGSATSPDPDNTNITADTNYSPEPVDDPNPSLQITQVASAPSNGSYYQQGESVTITITLTNDGNVTLTNIQDTENINSSFAKSHTVVSIAPDRSHVFNDLVIIHNGSYPENNTIETTVTAIEPENHSTVTFTATPLSIVFPKSIQINSFNLYSANTYEGAASCYSEVANNSILYDNQEIKLLENASFHVLGNSHDFGCGIHVDNIDLYWDDDPNTPEEDCNIEMEPAFKSYNSSNDTYIWTNLTFDAEDPDLQTNGNKEIIYNTYGSFDIKVVIIREGDIDTHSWPNGSNSYPYPINLIFDAYVTWHAPTNNN